jgi:hypothetical protein
MGLAGRTSPSAPLPRIGVIGDVTVKLKCRIMAVLADVECEVVWGWGVDETTPTDGMVVVGGKEAKDWVPGDWVMRELAGCFIQLPKKGKGEGKWMLVLPLNPDDETLERVRWLA